MPQFFADPVIILPAQKLHEVMILSDETLDHVGPLNDAFEPEYSTGADVLDGPHVDIVRRQLTRRLPLLTASVHEELVLGMERVWAPKHDEWTTVKAAETTMKIVSQAANRVFCGTELCRNPEWLEETRRYAISCFEIGFKLRPFPHWTYPATGPIAAFPVSLGLRRCKRICVPVIEARLKDLLDPSLVGTSKAPSDVLQWMLEDTIQRARGDLNKIDMDLIVRQLLILDMVAIHSTSIVTTNTLLDLYSHPDADMFVEGLREECERIFAECGGKWSKDAVDKLIRVDSTIRESMRMTPLVDLSLRRIVSASQAGPCVVLILTSSNRSNLSPESHSTTALTSLTASPSGSPVLLSIETRPFTPTTPTTGTASASQRHASGTSILNSTWTKFSSRRTRT
jgi:hypothetical protein